MSENQDRNKQKRLFELLSLEKRTKEPVDASECINELSGWNSKATSEMLISPSHDGKMYNFPCHLPIAVRVLQWHV